MAEVTLREDGIIKVELDPEKEFTVENAREISQAVFQLGGERRFPLMIIAGEHTTPGMEARQFIADERSNKFIKAEAYVLKTFDQKIVGKFYLHHENPARPTRLFESEEGAVEWLREFL